MKTKKATDEAKRDETTEEEKGPEAGTGASVEPTPEDANLAAAVPGATRAGITDVPSAPEKPVPPKEERAEVNSVEARILDVRNISEGGMVISVLVCRSINYPRAGLLHVIGQGTRGSVVKIDVSPKG